MYMRNTKAPALLRGFYRVGAYPVDIHPADGCVFGEDRDQGRDTKLGRLCRDEINARPFDRRENEPQIGVDWLILNAIRQRNRTVPPGDRINDAAPLTIPTVKQIDVVADTEPHDVLQIVRLRAIDIDHAAIDQILFDIKTHV